MKASLGILAASMLATMFSAGAEPEAREWTAKDGTVVRYRWSAPETIEPGKTYPLVLFMHGAGERGTDNTAHLKHGVRPIIEGTKKAGQPVFLIAPQCPTGRYWSPIDEEKKNLKEGAQDNALIEAVLELVEETKRKQPVDKKRFYVTGISMGGFATWDILGRIPKEIAAAIPICGGGDPKLAKKYKEVPIWAIHGDADPVVPVAATKGIVKALEEAGGKPKTTYYPGVKHESWTPAYDDPAVIQWMLDQKQK